MHSTWNQVRGLLVALTLIAFVGVVTAAAQTPAVISATSPGITIGPAHPTATVPVIINRDDTTPVLGFSVRIELSAEFAPLADTDVGLGNFLTDNGRATNLQVVNNGPGIYTIDGVTLGSSCGPPEQTGTLFTVLLRSTAAGGTGTMSFQSVRLRNCSNLPIPVNAGSGASVDIDNTAPSVTVSAPNGGETWVYQTTHAIAWSAGDAAGVAGVDLDYSIDDGINWTSIATGETNDGSYSWAIPNTPSANARVRVTAQDVNGNIGSDVSDAAFTILSNTAPALGAIGDRAVDEGTLLTFTATASDGEAPPQTLTFTLDPGAPEGAGITSGGLFTWTPTEVQGSGDYSITVRVRDDGTPAMEDFETISVQVNEVNLAPSLTGVPASATIPELVAYSFDADATDPDLPANPLSFSLVGAPTGAAIDPNTGVFTWTPTEAQGPNDFAFTVRVSDGTANTDASVTLHVTDTNSPPALSGVPVSATIPEMVAYSFDADATDTDIPAQTLTFSLAGAPAGAAIDPSTGVFTWTPAEAQGPNDYTFTVSVSDGVANTDAPVTLHVSEVNVAPVLSGVPVSATIPELVAYTFDADATDTDNPTQALTFSLMGAPAGAAIDPSSGVFTWMPTEAQGPNDYTFTVRVSDGVANTDASVTLIVSEVSIAAIGDLTVGAIRSGNDADGTIKLQLAWTATPQGTTVEVFRARFGAYPEYDDGGGMEPPAPAYPPTSPWEPTSVTAPGQTDEVNNAEGNYAGRDQWYYVAFVHGEGANISGPSNTPAALNYLLGDVSDGTPEGLGRGNNVVNGADVSALGDAYGLAGSAMTVVNYLDVGPTTDQYVTGRPITDNSIDFEDLVIFAINFGVGEGHVSTAAMQSSRLVAAKSDDRLIVEAPAQVTAGQEFTAQLRMEGSGQVQAFSAALSWRADVAQPLGVQAGEWLTHNEGVAFSPKPGVVDVALLGARASGFAGEGVVAVVRFRALATGAPQVGIGTIKARDASNRQVPFATSVLSGESSRPTATMLSRPFPNPFRGSITMEFSLVETGPATLSVFDVGGRRVCTLASGRWEAGVHRFTWNGRDDAGSAAPAGIYFAHLTTARGQFTQRIINVR